MEDLPQEHIIQILESVGDFWGENEEYKGEEWQGESEEVFNRKCFMTANSTFKGDNWSLFHITSLFLVSKGFGWLKEYYTMQAGYYWELTGWFFDSLNFSGKLVGPSYACEKSDGDVYGFLYYQKSCFEPEEEEKATSIHVGDHIYWDDSKCKHIVNGKPSKTCPTITPTLEKYDPDAMQFIRECNTGGKRVLIRKYIPGPTIKIEV